VAECVEFAHFRCLMQGLCMIEFRCLMLSIICTPQYARVSNYLENRVGLEIAMVLNVKATLWVGRCSQLCSSIAGIRVGFRWDVD